MIPKQQPQPRRPPVRQPLQPPVRKPGQVAWIGGGGGGVTGLLSASFTVFPNQQIFDLTTLGPLGWAQYDFPVGPVKNKMDGGPDLGDIFGAGGSSMEFTNDFQHTVSFTNGVPPTVSLATKAAVYAISSSRTAGMGKNLAAGTTLQRAKIICGCYNARMFLQAALSDGSAPAIVDYDTNCVGSGGAVQAGILDIQWRAATPGQTLAIILGVDVLGGSSNSGIQAICLY